MITWTVGGVSMVLMLWVLLRLNRAVQASLGHNIPLEGRSTDYPPISIIKPVYGADAHTAESFRSWAEQDYPAPLQLALSFQRADDPALPIARAVNGPHECTVIVNPVVEGFSGKMSNLLHGLQAADHGFLVFSDSDIRAEPDLCRRLATLHGQDTDLISCLMRHIGGRNV